MKLRHLPITILLMVVLAANALAAASPEPAADRWPVKSLAEVELRTSVALDMDRLAAEDRRREAEGLPWRFAEPEDVQLSPGNSGTWETLPDGRGLWRLRLAGPGALSMNLGFTRFYMPGDAVLRVYAPGDRENVQTYDRSDNADHGQLWTPVVLGDEVVVELEIDPADRADLGLELTQVNRGYRFFGEDLGDKSGSCNVDVVCPEGDDWRDQIDAVAMLSIGGMEKCTGFMVNNTARDGRPLLVTAAHCSLHRLNQATLVAYWNFQSPNCGDQGGGSKLNAQTGSTWLATTADSDFTIVELEENPDPDWHVKYAGWNRGETAPTSAVAIHHPSTDEKSISFENDPLTVSSYYDFPPNLGGVPGSHLKVTDWDLGTTEGGSSGSPLFDQDGYVVGELHGGDAACYNNSPDWYGRLAFAWDEGATASGRLRDWLDPTGTGAVSFEGYDPLDYNFSVSGITEFVSEGWMGGTFSPGQAVFTLTHEPGFDVTYSVETSESWLEVDVPTGTIPVGGQVSVTVSLGDDVALLSAGVHTAEIRIINLNGGYGSVTIPASITVRGLGFEVEPEEVAAIQGVVDGGFKDQTMAYVLTNVDSVPIEYQVELTAGWLEADSMSGTIPLGGETTVTVSFSDSAGSLPAGTHEGRVIFTNPASVEGSVIRQILVTLYQEGILLGKTVPNPFRTYTEIQFNLVVPGRVKARIFDLTGRMVREFGWQDFPAGENTWAWGGDDGAGRRLPSGIYVFELQGAGAVHRTKVTLTR